MGLLARLAPALLVMGPLEAVAVAADDVIWRIGSTDGSYAEFAIAGRPDQYAEAFPEGVRFVVGTSEPAREWPYVHPGPADGWTGARPVTEEIVFDLPSPLADIYELQLDLVDCHPTEPPTIEVRTNGIPQDVSVEPGVSEDSVTDPKQGRRQTVRAYIRKGCLNPGANTIAITNVRGSWMLYDSLSFSVCTTPPDPVTDISVVSLCLFKKDGAGLKQAVQVRANLSEPRNAAAVEILADGQTLAVKEFADLPAGVQLLDLLVPPVSSPKEVTARIAIDGKSTEAEGTILPQKRWKLYLVTGSHYDIGYTSSQDYAEQVHRENAERAIAWCGEYPEFVWDLEGARIAQDYLQTHPRHDDFIALAKQGRIGVMGFFANELTGICSSEGLTRLLDYYDYLRHTYGIESKFAMLSDVPGMVNTVPMILAGHGIKYLSHGINATRARDDQPFYNTPHYWESPDGSRVLMWQSHHYGIVEHIVGPDDTPDLSETARKIVRFVDPFTRRDDYPYDAILFHGAYTDNVANDESLASVPARWNAAYEYPKLIFCRGREFFEYIESSFAKCVPTVTGDSGVWWEDGAGSSARETAITRAAKEELITAEKLATLCDPAFARELSTDLDKTWEDALLYDEHTWGAAQSVSDPESQETREQWAVKKAHADRASQGAGPILQKAMDRFCSDLRAKVDSIVVFNPSSWTRSERVEVTGLDGKRLTLFADAIPPMGYKVMPLSKATRPNEKRESGTTIENRYYTVAFDPATGAIKSIVDRDLNRELVDSSGPGLNAYLYAAGPEDTTKVSGSANPTFAKVRLPDRQVMRIKCDAPMAKGLTVEVVLHDNEKRIDFVNRLDKMATCDKEGGYFAFPFAFNDPQMRIEVPDGVLRPDIDQMQGACRDWYCAQHFVTVSDAGAAVIWTASDSPLLTLQDINRGLYRKSLPIANGHIFAYVFNNYWFTNYKASQDGLLTFRFSLTSCTTVADMQAKRFGESVQSPLIVRVIRGQQGETSPTQRSYLDIQGDGVVLQAMKPARFTDGTVIRLREMSNKQTTARLKVNGITFKRAFLCNLAEDTLSPLKVDKGEIAVPCRPLGLTAILLDRR